MAVVVLGRFPPPLDGQAVATERLASLLDSDTGGAYRVARVDVAAAEGEHARAGGAPRVERLLHYARARRRVARALAVHPQAPVLWTSVSPGTPGHWRDRLAIAPAIGPAHRVFAVVHHGDFARVFRQATTRASARRLAHRLDGVVFLSQHLSERCAPFLPERKRWVVPNTIADDVVCTPNEVEARRAAGGPAPGRPLRLLYLSNMIPSKGYLDVLEAVGRLHAAGVAVEGTFAGRWESDAAREAFGARARTLGLGEAVTHLGGVSDRAQVRSLYLSADVFVLPTSYPTEAQPLTILEAMNAGTPVVATAHAAIPEMVRDGREGRLVPPHAPDEIARAVASLAERDVWEAASQAARARFMAGYSAEAVRRRWVGLLREAALQP